MSAAKTSSSLVASPPPMPAAIASAWATMGFKPSMPLALPEQTTSMALSDAPRLSVPAPGIKQAATVGPHDMAPHSDGDIRRRRSSDEECIKTPVSTSAMTFFPKRPRLSSRSDDEETVSSTSTVVEPAHLTASSNINGVDFFENTLGAFGNPLDPKVAAAASDFVRMTSPLEPTPSPSPSAYLSRHSSLNSSHGHPLSVEGQGVTSYNPLDHLSLTPQVTMTELTCEDASTKSMTPSFLTDDGHNNKALVAASYDDLCTSFTPFHDLPEFPELFAGHAGY